MALSLSPDEAQAKINQIDTEMLDVRGQANRILDSTEAICGRSWQGGRAATFSRIMVQHHEDFNTVLNNMQRIVDKGKADIQTLVAHDQ
jgi:hypothetical protein